MCAKSAIPAVEKSVKLLHVLAAGDEGHMTCAQHPASQLSISQMMRYRVVRSLVAHDWLHPTVAGDFTFSEGAFPSLDLLCIAE
ncbi:hypothetical protein [Cerasicoccus maritimus]|uniref:hypothetical protein n=1 Tax=Cerasicoccus maritimus TaxID=490089 RepID=UPI00285252FC|nr:hypothetical protein [Cerasicoccus maritimus]